MGQDRVLPINSLAVAKYITYMRGNGAAHSAFKTIIFAVKWINSFFPGITKFNCPVDDQFLAKLKDSALRGTPKNSNTKEPLTGEWVKKIVRKAVANGTLVGVRNGLMPAMAYSLLLRHDEICHLNCKHILSEEKGFKITIPSSKTDVLKKGNFVFLAKESGEFSVHSLLEKYLKMAGLKLDENHFLFTPVLGGRMVNEKLSYTSYAKVVKAEIAELGLNPNFFGTHSLRKGGATDLASEVTEFELLVSGRWADARSLQSYVKIKENRRYEISQNLFLADGRRDDRRDDRE